MTTLLVRHARVLVTMDADRREIADGAVFIRDHVIEAVGTSAQLAVHVAEADEVIDATDQVVLPGLVNTHHHMVQSLTRAVRPAQDCDLFGWLRALYPVWARLTPEMVHAATQTAMAELLLSGCTTTSDHLYVYPNGVRLDDSIAAADAIGMRFHAARGAMSVGESQGGLPPDALVEREPAILHDMQDQVARWHDPSRHAMRRIVLAPCSPFTVSQGLMRDTAALARSHGAVDGVRLHTHLAENDDDVAHTRDRHGCTPAEYAERVGWLGPDVWHAHCVKLDAAGIARFAETGTGVAHCPGSNMRLGSGIAPIGAMRAAGVPVAIAVDGCASNDAGHLLGEARLAFLLQRVAHRCSACAPVRLACEAVDASVIGAPHVEESAARDGPPRATMGLRARDVLELATLGGARVLGRDDIGALAPGMSADLITVPLDEIGMAGAQDDPVAALLYCHVPRVRHSVVNGRVVVRDGVLTTLPLRKVIARHNRLSTLLLRG